MKPALEDLEHRRPVWEALSSLFLDTDTSLSRPWRVGILAASPYSIEELQQILIDEVYPVCRSNLWQIAGEWIGFDPQWLESRILRRLRSPLCRFFHTISLGKLTIPLSNEWRHTKDDILRRRAQDQSVKTANRVSCDQRKV
jgi:hypothetical protein